MTAVWLHRSTVHPTDEELVEGRQVTIGTLGGVTPLTRDIPALLTFRVFGLYTLLKESRKTTRAEASQREDTANGEPGRHERRSARTRHRGMHNMGATVAAPNLGGGHGVRGAWWGNLGGLEEFLQNGYRIVSHTFTLLEDESGVITCILVR